MREHATLAPWVRRFLLEHIVAERNLGKRGLRAPLTSAVTCAVWKLEI